MISIVHEKSFNANSSSNLNLTTNEFVFNDDHKFMDGESVIYKTGGTKAITGLTTDSEYYVFVTTQKKLTLHPTSADGIGRY